MTSSLPNFLLNTLRPKQSGRHFPDDISKYIFVNETFCISINISLKFVPKSSINNAVPPHWGGGGGGGGGIIEINNSLMSNLDNVGTGTIFEYDKGDTGNKSILYGKSTQANRVPRSICHINFTLRDSDNRS